MEELGKSTAIGYPAYKLTTLPREEILQNHNSVVVLFTISLSNEDLDLPKLDRIPKLHNNPYKYS